VHAVPTPLLFGPYAFSGAGLAPNGGTFSFWTGPTTLPIGTFTATAFGLPTIGPWPQSLEVVQHATRPGGAGEYWLGIAVRNNSPIRCPYFEVFISVVPR
jgi:hypothetical protein